MSTAESAIDVLIRYALWAKRREDIGTLEGETGKLAHPDDWMNSDDEGVELAHALATVLRRMVEAAWLSTTSAAS